MKGQLSDNEFKEKLCKAGILRSGVNYINNTAWIMYGKYTVNYYIQHEDKSWTNYDCKTN